MTTLEYQRKACTILKQTREASGKTQDEIAKLVGVCRQTVNSWECGNTLPTMEYVLKWLDVLRISGSILTDDHCLEEIRFLAEKIVRLSNHEKR